MERLSKIFLAIGAVLVGLGLLATASGVVLTSAAVSAPGLSDADRTRIWRNGLSEAAYNTALAALVAVPAFLVARWSRRRVDPGPRTPPPKA